MWESKDCSGSPVAPLPVDMPFCTGAPYDFNFGGLTLGRTLPVLTKIKRCARVAADLASWGTCKGAQEVRLLPGLPPYDHRHDRHIIVMTVPPGSSG